MQDSVNGKKPRKGLKISLIAGMCAIVLAGGIGVATAPSWAQRPVESDAKTPVRTSPGLGAPVIKPLELGVTPTDGANEVNPAIPAVVKAGNGKIKSVTLNDGKGVAVPGTVSADGSTWTASEQLKFDTNYTFDYTVGDGAGRETHKTEQFHTVVAANEANAWTYIGDGKTVGVAQPVEIDFSEPVTNKAAVEKAIKITTTDGRTGAFHWYSDTKVRYRPETFWTANTSVTVDMELFGVDFGGGQIGNFNKKFVMNIGDKKVAIADAEAKTFDVYINDVKSQHWAVTMGDARFPSAPGYLVLMEHQRRAHFVASTIGLKPGDPADYGELDVEYATRLTPSGEFIHGAPWAAQYFGNTNISHGCIGMPLDGAAWVFNNMGIGDTVQVINSAGEPALVTDGFQDWNIPWAQYANA